MKLNVLIGFFNFFFPPKIGNVLVPSALPLALVTQWRYRKNMRIFGFASFTKKDGILLLIGRILRGNNIYIIY